MRGRIDLDELWRDAVERAGLALEAYDRALSPDTPALNPLSWSQLLRQDLTVDEALTSIGHRSSP